MKNNNECLADRDNEIYREFLTGEYTLQELGEKYNLHKSRVGRIIDKFLTKK